MRDYQQSKLYSWQNTIPQGGVIKIENAQSIVDHIWAAEGLKYPPKVQPIHFNTTKWAGKADRMNIYLQSEVSMQTIIHEVAHSLTMDIDDNCAQHGPWFVGVYTKLIEKYLGVSMPVMLYTLNKYDVDTNVLAHPIFLDD